MHRENHMIIIGISDYADSRMKNLPNARSDAERLLNILRTKYNFQVWEKPLYDGEATRKQIGALIRSIATIFKGDNLIIFFAGHGLKDPFEDIGYWVPAESGQDLGDCYANSEVITYIERCPAHHVLLISDSCFCGTFIKQTRAATVALSHDQLDTLASRWVFVSGGIDTVSDGRPGEGSPFGKSIIHFLESNQASSVAAEELFDTVIAMTKAQSGQEAEAMPIICPQNLGGQMIFRLSTSSNTEEMRGIEENIIQRSSSLPRIDHYIPRTISPYTPITDELAAYFGPQKEQAYLKDILMAQSRVVLLGSAGSGKSVELQYMARELAENGRGLVPVYKKLNAYVNENIEDFVQSDWHKVNPERVVFILDGLDEIQPQHFYTAVRKIQTFSESNPLIKLVVSCRTNFYEFPSQSFVGTLEGFSVQLLNDISLKEISRYVSENWEIDGKKFIPHVNDQGYLDLVSKPYFLDVLIKYFKKNGNLSSERFAIMAGALDDYYEDSKAHFYTVISYPPKKHVFRILEKIAFVMETMGKNFLTDDELAEIFEPGAEYDLIKYLPLFKKNEEDGRWMFVHNNIQEFLASSVLQRQSFEKIVSLISIQSAIGARIKPTWINTVSFFISIGEVTKVTQLLKWIVDNDQETLIRFEPERIGKDTRIGVFKNVFDSYNEKRIWLSSNKFSDVDLARFGDYPEILDYLLEHINNPENAEIILTNAVQVLDNFDLSKYVEYKVKVQDSLVTLLKSGRLNVYGKYTVIRALAQLGITDEDTLEKVVGIFRKSNNQYIRSALYRLLLSSPSINDYVDIFFDGLDSKRRQNFEQDRDSVNLMDEQFNLGLGLRRITDPGALKDLLLFLENADHLRFFYTSNLKEIVDDLIANAIAAYKTTPSILEAVLSFFISVSSIRNAGVSNTITRFFTETSTRNEAMDRIWRMEGVAQYRQEAVLVALLDEGSVDHFLHRYNEGEYSTADIEILFKIINWNAAQIPGAGELAKKIAVSALEKDRVELRIPIIRDWTALNKMREQKSFDLLFDKNALKEAIQQVFIELGRDELGKEEFYELRKQSGENIEETVLPIVAEIIRNILFDKTTFHFETQTVTFREIENWLNDDAQFDVYQIDHIYTYLNSQENTIVVSEEQNAFITKWCIEEHNEDVYLWFFIQRFKIHIQEERLLPFTLYFDHANETEIEFAGTIELLESFLPKEKIVSAVETNLSNPEIDSLSWTSNAGYALRNNLTKLYPLIVRHFKTWNQTEYKLSDVLKYWFDKTGDSKTLIEIITQTGSFDIRKESLKLLKRSGKQDKFLIEYFINKINSEHGLHDEKIAAANDLIQMGKLEGFYFLAEMVQKRNDPTLQYSHLLRSFKMLTDVRVIDTLISLLALAMQPSFRTARFDRLDTPVLEAIYSIGVNSEENFEKVETALLGFIQENESKLPDINFLHINIARMRGQLDLNISKSYGLEQAVKEFNSLDD